MTFLTTLGVKEVLCNFRLVLEGKAGKEIPESSRLENFQNFFQIKEILFRVHMYRNYWQILYSFQSSYKPTLIFPGSYYQTKHTFQSIYIPILILSESYYATTHIFHSTYKQLLANKTRKTFSDFILNIINIFKGLLKNNAEFFKLMSNNKHFQIEFLLILRAIFR